MRRARIGLGLCLLAVFAVVPAGVASAKSSALKLTVGGSEVAVGSGAETGIALNGSGCTTWSSGKVAVNGAAKDKLSTPTSEVSKECPVGSEVTGGITSLEVSAKAAKIVGTVTLTTAAKCQYQFKNPKVHWLTKPTAGSPSQTVFEGVATGKLSPKVAGCAKTLKETVLVVGADSLQEPFTAEL